MAQITVEVPDELILGRNGRIGTLKVVWEKVPQNVLDHIARVYYAQYITDKANSGGKYDSMENRFALAQKKLDSMYAGNIRIRSANETEVQDPIESEAFKLLRAKLHETYLGANEYKSVEKGTKDRTLFVFNRNRKAKGFPTFDNAIDAWEDFLGAENEFTKSIWSAAEKIVAEKQNVKVNLKELGI